MSITIFYILLLVVQIVMLILSIKNNTKKNWSLLISTILSSILLVIVFSICTWFSYDYIGWNIISYIVINFIAEVLFILMLIISIIIKVNRKKKKSLEKEEDKKAIKKVVIINIVTIVIAFIIALFLEYLPYRIEQKNNKIAEDKAKKQIITLLNKQYGDGNFKIVKMEEKNLCYDCSWLTSGTDGFEFEISTKYFDKNFIVSLTKDKFKIYDNKFLNEYYREKLGTEDLESYIEEYKIKKLNDSLSQNFNVEIRFNNTSIKDYSNVDFGKIPSIDELSNYVDLQDPKFDIKENLKTKEELLNYLVKFTKYYIKDFDTSNITYSQTNKYFRYKYDYTKLGVNDYSDQYDGYGGYVLAGNIKYSEEQGHYVTEDEDTIVRINIMGEVTTFNLKDILEN